MFIALSNAAVLIAANGSGIDPAGLIIWIVISLVLLVVSILGIRAAMRGMPNQGVFGRSLLVLAILVCVVAFGFSVCCGGCAGLVLVGGLR